MERRGKFHGSLWLGIRGLRWALDEMGKLKDSHLLRPVPSSFCEMGIEPWS
jgi:hypothetical protein